MGAPADYTSPQFWPQLKQLALSIDGLDYYQILNLDHSATAGQIKASYYSMARALHPDKFYHLPDEELKTSILKIYKRITEAHTILKDEPKRLKYRADVMGPERAKKLRFTEESEAETKKQAQDSVKVAKTPKGEQLYKSALLDMQNKKWDAAFKNIQSALLFEGGNQALKDLLAEIDKKRKGG
jgi:DnaJ-class molecular chaperone